MESADAKMIRAHENIEGVAREINDWFASIQVKIYLKTAPGNPAPWLVVHATDHIPPIRLSVLIGECVHNMRSAVDNLVCGLALTLKSTCKCRDLAFPVYKDQAEWDEKADKPLKGIPPLAKEAIRQLQPWADTVSPNLLTILNKLSNIDKHRACNFTLAYGHDVVFRVHCNNGVILNLDVKEPLYLGDVHTIPLQIDKRLVEGSARVQTSGTFVLTLREESDWDDIPVMKVLEDCFDHIERRVVPKLKPFFEKA
ncbi:MAG: hypothetical protein ABI806_28350 [Candidatus Solibacter sp.]